MSDLIHPTAVIDPAAQIGAGVSIGPFCVIGPHVVLHDDVVLKSHVVIDGHTVLGQGVIVHPFASLGGPPQDLKYAGEPTELHIGARTVIREHVTMNPGTVQGAGKTVVGSDCLFMMGAHVAHDCVVGDRVILANNATLAGHVQVGDFVIIGGLSAVHQFIRIGSHAIIGGMSGVEANVIPYGRVKGERAHLAGLNLIGMERRGFSKDEVRTLQKAFKQIFGAEGSLDQRLTCAARDYADNEHVKTILDFAVQESQFPLCQPPKK